MLSSAGDPSPRSTPGAEIGLGSATNISMPEIDSILTFLAAFALCVALTPLAIRLAKATGFMDRPGSGYKQHGRATPYLGGLAVTLTVLIVGVATGSLLGDKWPILLTVIALWALGTVDDRRGVAPRLRVAVELAAAAGIALADLGWHVTGNALADGLLTAAWIVGIVNAVNLMDNMDGAAGTLGLAVSGPVALVAAAYGDADIQILAIIVAGACLGFLPFNLFLRPARIFLGDGGSMPLGALLAIMTMRGADTSTTGLAAVLLGGLLIGLAVLDTALVTISRRRRGISLLTGGKDHLTHRLHGFVESPRRVAGVLAVSQTALGLVALTAVAAGASAVTVLGLLAMLGGLLAIAGLEWHWVWREEPAVARPRWLGRLASSGYRGQ